MDLKELKKLAHQFDQKEWPFSAAQVWKEVVALDPSPYHKIYYAEQLYYCGDFEAAETVLNGIKAYQILPQQQCFWFTLKGRIYTEQNKIELAVNAFKKGIEVGTEESYTYVFLGTLLARIGELDEAKQVFFQALEKDGDIAEVYYN
ncbi:MAG: hypothetical protein AAFP19_24160, partial [Bacteroidota bacterium]